MTSFFSFLSASQEMNKGYWVHRETCPFYSYFHRAKELEKIGCTVSCYMGESKDNIPGERKSEFRFIPLDKDCSCPDVSFWDQETFSPTNQVDN